MGTLFSDNFNRADSTSLGTTWSEDNLNWSIASNQLNCQSNGSGSPGVAATTTTAMASVADMKVTVTVNTVTSFDGGPIARRTSSGVFYAADIFKSGSNWVVEVYRHNSLASSTLIGSTTTLPAAHVAGTTYSLEVSGSGATVTLKVYQNGTLAVTFTDTSASRITAAGQGGCYSWTSVTGGANFDDFLIEDLAAAPSFNVKPTSFFASF